MFGKKKQKSDLVTLEERVNGVLAENLLLNAKNSYIEKLAELQNSEINSESIAELSFYCTGLLLKLESAEQNAKNRELVGRIRNAVDSTIDAFIQRINSRFNEVYRKLDCFFFVSVPEAEKKSGAYRNQLDEFAALYSQLNQNLGLEKTKWFRRVDPKLSSYVKLIQKLQPVKQKLDSLLSTYVAEAFRSEHDFVVMRDEVNTIHLQYNSAVNQCRPARIVQYHVPFELREQFYLLSDFRKELAGLAKEFSGINHEKIQAKRNINSAEQACEHIGSMLCFENSDQFIEQFLSETIAIDQLLGDFVVRQEKYPLFLGIVAKEYSEIKNKVASKLDACRSRAREILITDFSTLQQIIGPTDIAAVPQYLVSLQEKDKTAAILEARFELISDKEYAAKCSSIKKSIQEKTTVFAETADVYKKISSENETVAEELEKLSLLASKLTSELNAQNLVELKAALDNCFNASQYSCLEENPYLRDAAVQYHSLTKEYEIKLQAAAEQTIASIDSLVAEIKGEDLAAVDRALAFLEILDSSKNLSQKVDEKIIQLQDLRCSLKKKKDIREISFSSATENYPPHGSPDMVMAQERAETGVQSVQQWYAPVLNLERTVLTTFPKPVEQSSAVEKKRPKQSLYSFLTSKEMAAKYLPIEWIINTKRGGDGWDEKLVELARKFSSMEPARTKEELGCIKNLQALFEKDALTGHLAYLAENFTSLASLINGALASLNNYVMRCAAVPAY